MLLQLITLLRILGHRFWF